MFFELRQYRTLPGQRERWVRFMEETIIPFQISKGMVVVSFGRRRGRPLYLDSPLRQRTARRLYAAVYESDYWKNEIAPQVGEMLDRSRTVVARIAPTPKSVIR